MLFRQALDSHSLIHTTPKAPDYKHATFRWPSGGMTRRSTQRVHPVFREFLRGISPRVKVTKIDEITKIKSGQSHAWYSPAILNITSCCRSIASCSKHSTRFRCSLQYEPHKAISEIWRSTRTLANSFLGNDITSVKRHFPYKHPTPRTDSEEYITRTKRINCSRIWCCIRLFSVRFFHQKPPLTKSRDHLSHGRLKTTQDPIITLENIYSATNTS